jgi:hypothetical protein
VDYVERRAALIVKRLVVEKGEAPWQKGGGAGMAPRQHRQHRPGSRFADDSGGGSGGDGSLPEAGAWEDEAAAAAHALFARVGRASAAATTGSDGRRQWRRRLRGNGDRPRFGNESARQPGRSNRERGAGNSGASQTFGVSGQRRRRLAGFCPPGIPLCAALRRAKKQALLAETKAAIADRASAQAAAALRGEANVARRAAHDKAQRAASIELQWAKESAAKAAEVERTGAFKEYMRSHKGEMVNTRTRTQT